MDTEINNKCLGKLKIVLSEKTPLGSYSLNGYSEDAVCLEAFEDTWEVYNGERNQKFGVKTFDNVIEAGIEVTMRLAYYEPNLKILFLESIIN